MRLRRTAFFALLLGVGFSVRAQSGPADRVVQLPPLIVEEARENSGRPWQYLAFPGVEILSRCSGGTTADFARGYLRVTNLIQLIAPAEFQASDSMPSLLLLYNQDQAPQLPAEIVAEMNRLDPESGLARGVRYSLLPNLTLRDRDFSATYSILNERSFEGSGLRLTPENLRARLEERLPALPRWFVEGVMRLYPAIRFDPASITLSPATWVNAVETRAILRDRDRPRALLGLAELFREHTAVEAPAESVAYPFKSQAALFVRWALDGKKRSRRDALMKFVARASESPATEAMFQECFDLDYADARDRLSDYLATAVANDLTLKPSTPLPKPRLAVRPANSAEVARLKGDWERLTITYVREHFPMLVTPYFTQARRTQMRAYDTGERDPRLLAVIGLTACDMADDAAARPFLEAATQAGVARPRVYFETARLRLAEVMTRLETDAARFSLAQTDEVLQPLQSARPLTPAAPAAYDLAARVLLRSARAPTPDELAWLSEGPRLFPQSVVLTYRVAALLTRHGTKADAAALIDGALARAAEPSTRAPFEQLRTELAQRKE